MPEFDTVAVGMAYETAPDAPPMPQLRLTEDASAETINWPNLGYADAYTESFEMFERMQNEGTVAADVRLQVQYPTPLASMAGRSPPTTWRRSRPRTSRRCSPTSTPCSSGSRTIGSPSSGTSRSSSELSRARWARSADRPDRTRARPLPRARARRRPGRHAPLLRRLRSPALQAARVAADAGRPRQRRDLRHQAHPQLRLVHRPPGTQRQRLLRAARRTHDRARHRAELRARPLPPGRSGTGHDR